MKPANLSTIHFITDNSPRFSPKQQAALALQAGIRIIQYRRKEGSKCLLFGEAGEIMQLCREYKALLVINDHMDLTLAVGAEGLHLGQDDLPLAVARKHLGGETIIGASVRNMEQARQAKQSGADYLGYGPVFATSSKADAGEIKGLLQLEEFCRRVKEELALPVVALGGVNLSNLVQVKRAGADGVALISAISQAADPRQAARQLLQAFAAAPV